MAYGRVERRVKEHTGGEKPSQMSDGLMSCYPLGSLDVYGMKGLLSVLDVKTDRIHHTVSASKCISD